MHKLNLDISKYSNNELRDIFKINSDNNQQITKHINSYKNNLLIDNNLTLSEKDNISNFLNNVIKKLTTNSLDKNNNNFSILQNNLIKNTDDNHPVIINPNTIAGLNAKSYEGRNIDSDDFPPGNINPINIKTIKKTVNIDTRFRSSYYTTKSSDFNVSLPEQFKKVVNLLISSIEIPLTIYSISKSLGNSHFFINSDLIDISSGNYSSHINHINSSTDLSNNIIDSINTSITSSIHYSIDPISGKSIFKNSGPPCTIYFNKDYNNNDDLDTPLPLKLGWLLGFRAGAYNLNTGDTIISEAIVSITGPKYIYICINDFTNAANNNFTAAFSSSTLSPHIIARVNYQALIQSNGIYNIGQDDDLNDSINRTREYFGPVDIQKLNFQILDEYGRIVDFNNMDWSCALTFSTLYD